MKAHLQQAIFPITATAAFFGLALIEDRFGKPQRFISFLYSILVFSVQVGMYTLRLLWLNNGHVIFVKWVVDFMIFCCTFIILVSICLTHWHGKRYYRCVERFNEVDKTIRDLGIETDYSNLKKTAVVSVVTWVLSCVILNVYDSLDRRTTLDDKLYAVILYFVEIPLHIPRLVYIHFWLILRYAGSRFDCISNALRKLTIDNETILVEGVPDERTKRIIWTLMHLHFQLCKTLEDINGVFETQLNIQMNFDCVYILSTVIFTFRMILVPFEGDKLTPGLIIWVWTLPYFAEVIITNHLCEMVVAKARTVCDMAVQVMRSMDDKKMCEDVSLIVLQTRQRPLRFSCLGLYYFGYQFMYKIFSSLATNTVIILQLKTGFDS